MHILCDWWSFAVRTVQSGHHAQEREVEGNGMTKFPELGGDPILLGVSKVLMKLARPFGLTETVRSEEVGKRLLALMGHHRLSRAASSLFISWEKDGNIRVQDRARHLSRHSTHEGCTLVLNFRRNDLLALSKLFTHCRL